MSAKGNYREAIKHYDKALEIDPRMEYAWSDKGMALGMLGQYVKAIQCYDRALEINPESIRALCDKGEFLEKVGKFEEAIACYNKVCQIDPASSLPEQIRRGDRLKTYRGRIRLGGKDIR